MACVICRKRCGGNQTCSKKCNNALQNRRRVEARRAELAAIELECEGCGATFTPERTRLQRFCSRACNRATIARRLWRSNKAKLVGLMGGKCERCGLVDDPCVYDFHHKDPSKKEFTMSSNMNSKSFKQLVREAKKCELLCATCHRKEHSGN